MRPTRTTTTTTVIIVLLAAVLCGCDNEAIEMCSCNLEWQGTLTVRDADGEPIAANPLDYCSGPVNYTYQGSSHTWSCYDSRQDNRITAIEGIVHDATLSTPLAPEDGEITFAGQCAIALSETGIAALSVTCDLVSSEERPTAIRVEFIKIKMCYC